MDRNSARRILQFVTENLDSKTIILKDAMIFKGAMNNEISKITFCKKLILNYVNIIFLCGKI